MMRLFLFGFVLLVLNASAQQFPLDQERVKLVDFRVSTDSLVMEKLIDQADSIFAASEYWFKVFRDQPSWQIFSDINHDQKIDLFVTQMMMGNVFYLFFPGTESGLGEPSTFGGSIANIKPFPSSDFPTIDVIQYPCCGGYTTVYYSMIPFESPQGVTYYPDTIIEFFEDVHEVQLATCSKRFTEFMVVADSALLFTEAQVDTILIYDGGGLFYQKFPATTKGIVMDCYTDSASIQWIQALMPIEPFPAEIRPDKTFPHKFLLGWMRREDVKMEN